MAGGEIHLLARRRVLGLIMLARQRYKIRSLLPVFSEKSDLKNVKMENFAISDLAKQQAKALESVEN